VSTVTQNKRLGGCLQYGFAHAKMQWLRRNVIESLVKLG